MNCSKKMRIAGRTILVVLLLLTAACSDKTESAARDPASMFTAAADNESGISAERIAREVVGYTLDVGPAAGQTPSVEWTFDADEERHVKILEEQKTGDGMAITVFMMTRSNPDKDKVVLELSGKLKIQYQRLDARWVLKNIENLSLRYALGIST